jgi:hypothetical protein
MERIPQDVIVITGGVPHREPGETVIVYEFSLEA